MTCQQAILTSFVGDGFPVPQRKNTISPKMSKKSHLSAAGRQNASPTGLTGRCAINHQFIPRAGRQRQGLATQKGLPEVSIGYNTFSVDSARNILYNYIGEVLPFWRKFPKYRKFWLPSSHVEVIV